MAQADFSIVVLISGNGSNLQAIIDADLGCTISAVISNRADAYGLIRAENAGIATKILPYAGFESRAAYDKALADIIDAYQPRLIILAGFMRILSADFVRHFPNKILNIHPSLLPKYPGLHTHQRALEANDDRHGVSIHIVTEELDAGPLLAQASFDITSEDTIETLQKQVQKLEHQLYPQVIEHFINDQIQLVGSQAFIDGKAILS